MTETCIVLKCSKTLQVIVHQVGHVVGLAHTNRVTSVMVPYYYDWINEDEIIPDNVDIDMADHKQLHNHASCFMSTIGVLLCSLIVHYIYLFEIIM